MSSDMPPGADTPPIDELTSAEASLAELQKVVHPIGAADLGKQTPCTEFDIAGLTDHLMNSIAALGGAAGAQMPQRDSEDSVERQIVLAARPALDAWRRRGVDGTVQLQGNDVPAKMMAGILSIEFLIHAWDYAQAIGQRVDPTPELAEFVYGLARNIITPEGRTNVGFDDPVSISGDAPVFDKLLAFSGRTPG